MRSPFVASLVRAQSRRLASPAARFRLAVTAGFLVAAIGFTTVVVSDRDGLADDWFGAGGIFGLQQPAEPAQQAAAPSSWFAPRRHARRHIAKVGSAKVDSAKFIRSVERAHSLGTTDGPVELGRRSMCVRLCDGFAFPLGAYHGEQDRAAHEATCHSECPGAATALYVVPSGSDSMDEAVRVGTDKNYSELPYAFHYTTVLSSSCSCHPPEGGRIKSLLHDFTLRRGDAVMTSAGVKVFHGGSRFPYRRNDFVKLEQSRDIRNGDRATFRAIERASLISAPNVVAQIVPAKPAPQPARTATKGLEHQASLTPRPAPSPASPTP